MAVNEVRHQTIRLPAGGAVADGDELHLMAAGE